MPITVEERRLYVATACICAVLAIGAAIQSRSMSAMSSHVVELRDQAQKEREAAIADRARVEELLRTIRGEIQAGVYTLRQEVLLEGGRTRDALGTLR